MKKDKMFWKIAEENAREVATWPKWKQRIRITSARAMTGDFIARPGKDNRK